MLCELCVENTVMYFRDCPTCKTLLTTEPRWDTQLQEVMKRRYSTLKNEPAIVQSEQAKVAAAVRARLTSNRVVVEFGSEPTTNAKGENELVAFVNLIKVRATMGRQGGRAWEQGGE